MRRDHEKFLGLYGASYVVLALVLVAVGLLAGDVVVDRVGGVTLSEVPSKLLYAATVATSLLGIFVVIMAVGSIVLSALPRLVCRVIGHDDPGWDRSPCVHCDRCGERL